MSTAAAPTLWFRLAFTFAFGPPDRTYPGRLPGSRPAACKLGALSAAAFDAPPAAAPAECSDHEPRPGDEAFRLVTAAGVESVITAVAAQQPGVLIRRGVRATGLIAAGSAASRTSPGYGPLRGGAAR